MIRYRKKQKSVDKVISDNINRQVQSVPSIITNEINNLTSYATCIW